MAQNFKQVGNAASVKADLQTINDNFEAVKSNFSGSAFPTVGLIVGMSFHNTSTGLHYILRSMNPVVWENVLTSYSTVDHMKVTRVGGSYSAGSVSLIDQGKIDVAGACRTAFLPASGIKVEYSTDGGATYLDYGLTDEQKRGLCSMNRAIAAVLGKSDTQSLDKTLRITLSPSDNRYSDAEQFYCWFNTKGATCVLDVECSNIGAKDVFFKYKDNIPLVGWAGSNVVNLSGWTFGGGVSQLSNIYSYRFTFRMVAVHPIEVTCPNVSDLRIYGSNCWGYTNPKMFNDSMYTWDIDQNVTFPSKVAATEFVGKLNGTIEPIRIAAGTDLNTVVQAGMYHGYDNNNTSTLQNAPTTYSFSLLVERTTGGDGCKQTLTEFLIPSARTFYRNKYHGTWGPWYQNVDSNNIANYASQKITFTATDSRWGALSNDVYPLTLVTNNKDVILIMCNNNGTIEQVNAGVKVSGNNRIIESLNKFAGYVVCV